MSQRPIAERWADDEPKLTIVKRDGTVIRDGQRVDPTKENRNA